MTAMGRVIAMGDHAYFSVIGGANPHTRNWLGMRKQVDPESARSQWHALARELIAHGCEVYVIAPHPRLSGLVYPANAGFLYPLEFEPGEQPSAGRPKIFYLSNLLPSRAAEREVYGPFLRALGYETREIAARFEGEADFFPAAGRMIFTYGSVERQRFVPRFGLPPWRRIYGFRSQYRALEELRPIAAPKEVLPLELVLEAHYHGDTVICSFGPAREFLLAYLEGLSAAARSLLRETFGRQIIPLSAPDAEVYAANSFQVEHRGRLYLFMPEGVTDELLSKVRERSVEPVLINVSEFLRKGGGSIKCMILDLGPVEEQPAEQQAAAARAERSYARLYGP